MFDKPNKNEKKVNSIIDCVLGMVVFPQQIDFVSEVDGWFVAWVGSSN